MKRVCAPLFVTLVLGIILYMIGLIIHSLYTGSFPRIPGPPIYRASSPGWFWFDILLSAAVAVYGVMILYFDWKKLK